MITKGTASTADITGPGPHGQSVHSDDQPPWVRAYRQAVGARLRKRREQQDLTQLDLCYAAGVDRTTYQRWESGLSDPHLGELALMAQILHTTVDDLTRVPRPPEPGDTDSAAGA